MTKPTFPVYQPPIPSDPDRRCGDCHWTVDFRYIAGWCPKVNRSVHSEGTCSAFQRAVVGEKGKRP